MSDFDRNPRGLGYTNRLDARSWTSGSWIAGIIVAVLVIVAIGYAFSDRWTGAPGMIEHRASATDTAPAPLSPAPEATPAAKPTP